MWKCYKLFCVDVNHLVSHTFGQPLTQSYNPSLNQSVHPKSVRSPAHWPGVNVYNYSYIDISVYICIYIYVYMDIYVLNCLVKHLKRSTQSTQTLHCCRWYHTFRFLKRKYDNRDLMQTVYNKNTTSTKNSGSTRVSIFSIFVCCLSRKWQHKKKMKVATFVVSCNIFRLRLFWQHWTSGSGGAEPAGPGRPAGHIPDIFMCHI